MRPHFFQIAACITLSTLSAFAAEKSHHRASSTSKDPKPKAFVKEAERGSPENHSVHLPVMTWYHPLLEPGVSDILMLCSVTAVEPAPKLYDNNYWKVTLRIDERIHVDPRYQKRLEGVQVITSGDFRKRAVGERLLLFAGGEAYEGDDFLLPCWSGTETDLGILLHPKGHDDEDKDIELLKQLREAVKGKSDEADFLNAFAEYCPKGVAHHLIRRIQMEEFRRDEEQSTEHKK